jgi:hypothetical protein
MKVRGKMVIIESKQVGILYHFTDQEGLEGILNDGGLKTNYRNFISFTRSFLAPKSSTLEHQYVRITFDGNKLSNKYKFQPFADGGYEDEMEERILWPMRKVLKCDFSIIRIDILKKSLMKTFSKEDIEQFSNVKYPLFFVDTFRKR